MATGDVHRGYIPSYPPSERPRGTKVLFVPNNSQGRGIKKKLANLVIFILFPSFYLSGSRN